MHRGAGSASSGSVGVRPAAPTISGTVTIGGTLTVTPGTAGVPSIQTFRLYRDGLSAGAIASPYTYVAADIGPSLTVTTINAAGESDASNTLTWAGVAASLASGNILRDETAITLSGGAASAWSEAGGFAFDKLDSLMAGPSVVYCQGRQALKFDSASTQAMQAHTNGVPGTLDDLCGATSFHRFYVIRPDAVTDTSADIRDAECVFNDPAVTAYGFGFQKIAGTIYCTGGFVQTAMKQPTNSANNACTQGAWILVEEKYDHASTTYSVRVGTNTAVSVNTGGAMTPSRAGRVVMGRNYLTQYANFTLAFVAGAKAVQSAGVTADIRAFLTNRYLTEVELQASQATSWGNGDTTTAPIGFPDGRYSSDSMIVVDTDATTVRLAVGFEGTFGVTSANWREHQVAIGVGVSPNVVWSGLDPMTLVPAPYPVGQATYERRVYAPVSLPGAGTRRIWIVNPTRLSTGTGAYVTVQQAMFSAGATVTPVAQPSSGCLFASDAVDDTSQAPMFGWYVLSGVRQSAGGYDTARTASLLRWTTMISGQATGTFLVWSPHTNDLRNGATASDIGAQAQWICEDLLATYPTWKIIYVTLLPLRTVDYSQATQTAVSAAEIAGATTGGAHAIIDGQSAFWSHTQGVAGGIGGDNVHSYLDGITAAAPIIAARVAALGRSGKMIVNACAGIMGAFPAREAPGSEVFVPTNARSMSALLRKSGW